jgi:ParB-like chromosome segregation protein Spo0J
VAQIAASIREWGWTTPILVDEAGSIIAGHGRLQAARRLQMTEVPVVVASGWSEAQKRAYVIADNKLALECWLGQRAVCRLSWVSWVILGLIWTWWGSQMRRSRR